ncbi:MAG: GntR family transcriptional regulator [Pseudomonadota bacterium]
MSADTSPELSQGEAAYEQLYAAIQSGTYRPGDRLREVEVAAHLALSRTPVREALRKLESDGIVEHRPRIGAVVRRLGHSEVVELYEMREVQERTAAEMAAKHAAQAEADALSDLNEALLAAPSKDAAHINRQFHRGIYLAARNRFLLETARALDNALMLLGPTTLEDEARISTVHKQHQAIIEAIRTGDAAAAGTAAVAHLQTSLRFRLGVMRG